MPDLQPHPALEGRPPIAVWPWRVIEEPLDHVTALHRWPGARKAASEALKTAHGMAWPAIGRATGRAGNRCLSTGDGTALLVGPRPDVAGLSEVAALFDQTGGWVCLSVIGDGALAALAPCVSADLHGLAGKRGETRGCLIAGAPALIHQRGGALDLYLPRSFAADVHDALARRLAQAAALAAAAETGGAVAAL